MFKKLLLTALIFAGFNINTTGAMETPGVLQTTAPKGGALAWLKHFAVAHLCYNILMRIEVKTMDALFPGTQEDLSVETTQEQQFRTATTRLLASWAALYGCYKLTNYLHQQMSDEPYRWAHLLGALL